jgi:rhamnosyltransferase
MSIGVAVLVTYQPNHVKLYELLTALTLQVKSIIIVHNGSQATVPQYLHNNTALNCFLFVLGENLGLASAQNFGIEKAKLLGAEYVLMLDQDSLPAPDMVSRLLEAITTLQDQGLLVAAVGPRYTDQNQRNLRPFVRIRGLCVKRFDCESSDQTVQVDHLISSGSLIPIAVLDAIGGMREELFIDYVDTEWSLRASRMGYRLFGVCNATMRHSLGDRPCRVFGSYLPIHSPLRHYYLFRNAVWLYRQDWISWNWKAAILWSILFKLVFFSIVPRNRLSQVQMIFRGFLDGLRGRMGRLEV